MPLEGEPPLWVDGEILLKVAHRPDPVRIRRPYALLGRLEGSDLVLHHRDVSARHVYLHLDGRGLFAIDLASRTGVRFDGAAALCGWVMPGQALEVAGQRIEVLGARADGAPVPDRPPDYPLTDVAHRPLARVALYPILAPHVPWVLNSELVFLGRSPACGVPVGGASVARIHAVLVRTPERAYLVNLAGWGVWIDGGLVHTAAPLPDGAVLVVGSARFKVQVEPAVPSASGPAPPPAAARSAPRPPAAPAPPPPPAPAPAPTPVAAEAGLEAVAPAAPGPPGVTGPPGGPVPWTGELALPTDVPPLPPDLVPAESQTMLVGWMMGVLQATQAEMFRRQDEFQRELVRALRGLHEDNQAVLDQHRARVDAIHRELAALREDIRQRFGAAPPAAQAPAMPKPPPLRITPSAGPPPADPAAATAWLLNRVSQLDEASRSSWRDLLGRLGVPPRSGSGPNTGT